VPIRGIILITFFVGSLPFCFIRPFYGVALWAVIAFLNPQWYAWSAARTLPWALVVAIPTLAGFLAFCRGWTQRILTREVILLFLLWVWFTITSTLAGNNALFVDHLDDMWFRWNVVSKILLMAVVTVAVVDSFQRLRVLVIVMSCCFGFFVAKAFPFLIVTAGTYRVYGPPKSMIADNNDYGLALNMTLPLFFFLAQTEVKPWVRNMFWALFAMTIPSICFTYSRGALVGLVAVSGLMVLRSKQRLVFIPLLLIGAVLALLFAPDAWRERMDPTRPGALDASAMSRINAWTFCWRLASDYPIAGAGFGTFTPDLFLRYAPNPEDVHGPHSVYFGLLAEHGFVGLGLYLLLIGSTMWTASSIVKKANARGDHVAMCYANMFRISLVGFLASGTFLGRAYFDYVFSIIGCLVVLKQVCETQWREDDLAAEEEEHSSDPLAREAVMSEGGGAPLPAPLA